MNLKQRICERALELGFDDIGFTTTEPLDLYLKEIDSRGDMYNWVMTDKFNLREAASPRKKHPWARSLLVLIRNYHNRSFPPQLLGKIGRRYLIDERVEKGVEHQRVVDFLRFLKREGIRCFYDAATPARMSAARAGLVTYGKNCFAFARRKVLGASWLLIIPLLVDAEISPDEPSIKVECPSWCRNACMAACPTRAIYAQKKMRPEKCIAFQSYYSTGITAMELREPMGTWVYGCDRCQEVCPRNQPWMNQALPINGPLMERAEDFRLDTLLSMSERHYVENVWPLTFYIAKGNVAKWHMNAARALGNLGDRQFVPLLAQRLTENESEIVRGMCAWALGRLGGRKAKKALESQRNSQEGLVKEEIESALNTIGGRA